MILNQLKIRFSKIYFYSAILLSSLFLLFSSCEAETTSAMDSIPFFYKINRPDTVQELPAELMEISGLSPFQKDKIACIQDEAGIIYIYDWGKRNSHQSNIL